MKRPYLVPLVFALVFGCGLIYTMYAGPIDIPRTVQIAGFAIITTFFAVLAIAMALQKETK